MSPAQAQIQLQDLTRTFAQGGQPVAVLKGIDLSIGRGEFVALVGTSGSGKSTLMHILGLLDQPTGGAYLLDGSDVAHLTDDQLCALRNRTFGFIFQSFYLIPYATALDNVLLPGIYAGTAGTVMRQRAAELLAQVGLGDRLHFLPGQLSGGQQQRVALARALMNDPQILLADEPTGQLDAATSAEIMSLLESIHQQGRTIILVTHDQKIASHARRRIQLDDGRVVAG